MVTSGRIRGSRITSSSNSSSSTIDGRSFCQRLSVNIYFPRYSAHLAFRSRFVSVMRLPRAGFVCLFTFHPRISRPIFSAKISRPKTKYQHRIIWVSRLRYRRSGWVPIYSPPLFKFRARVRSHQHQTSHKTLQNLSPPTMTVVPQPAVQLRRATKADLPAIMNFLQRDTLAPQNSNIPGALPTSCPTRPKKHPDYQIWYDRLVKAIILPNHVLMWPRCTNSRRSTPTSSQAIMAGQAQLKPLWVTFVGILTSTLDTSLQLEDFGTQLHGRVVRIIGRPWIYMPGGDC